MHIPQIVIYYPRNPVDHLVSTGYLVGFSELDHEVTRLGGQLFVSGGQNSFHQPSTFAPAWKLEQGRFIDAGQVKADLIFDKGRFAGQTTAPVFNPSFINEVCTDKWLMYQLFSDMCPLTKLVTTAADLPSAIQAIGTDRIVVKPRAGMEGADILIGPADQAREYAGQLPALVSEFVDSSAGIPGIMTGRHDLRIAVLNGRLIYSEFKTPPPDSYIASVTRGGSYAAVPLEKIPPAALAIVDRIEQVMQREPNRFYAIDMMFGPDGPKLTEMNSRPAILPNSDGSDFAILKTELARVLVEIARNQSQTTN